MSHTHMATMETKALLVRVRHAEFCGKLIFHFVFLGKNFLLKLRHFNAQQKSCVKISFFSLFLMFLKFCLLAQSKHNLSAQNKKNVRHEALKFVFFLKFFLFTFCILVRNSRIFISVHFLQWLIKLQNVEKRKVEKI